MAFISIYLIMHCNYYKLMMNKFIIIACINLFIYLFIYNQVFIYKKLKH